MSNATRGLHRAALLDGKPITYFTPSRPYKKPPSTMGWGSAENRRRMWAMTQAEQAYREQRGEDLRWKSEEEAVAGMLLDATTTRRHVHESY